MSASSTKRKGARETDRPAPTFRPLIVPAGPRARFDRLHDRDTGYLIAGGSVPDERLEALAAIALIEHAPLGLALIDADKRYVRVNDALATLNGLPAADHIGKTPREALPTIGDAVESVIEHVIETKLPMVGIDVDPPGGGPSARVSLYPLIDEQRVIGVLGIADARR